MGYLPDEVTSQIPLKIFQRDYRWAHCYRLRGTSFAMWITHDSVHWAEIEIDLKEPVISDVSFEQVLSESPEDVQEELLFHLDILS
jgi:hypothetical protein